MVVWAYWSFFFFNFSLIKYIQTTVSPPCTPLNPPPILPLSVILIKDKSFDVTLSKAGLSYQKENVLNFP